MSNNNGINILGYINKQFGLGEGVRSNVRAIKAAHIPFVLNDFQGKVDSDIINETTESLSLSTENPYPINLIQLNVENFHDLLTLHDNSYFKGKYNIGFWAWELEKFPPYFQHNMELLDEIWVPSNFSLNAISQVSNKPVLRFLHSIDIPPTTYTRADFNLPEDKIIYLTIFDYNSFIERKNPYATIEAFERAFEYNPSDVLLVIKTSTGQNYQSIRKELRDRIKDNKNIILIEEVLLREKLDGLMEICDVYISLHRSEGFGLTMAEAMFLAKPVIGTAYSANIEYMNAENSFPIPYTLIPTANNYIYSDLENVWANPDVERTATIMSKLYNDAELRKTIGLKAQKYVKEHLSPVTIGTRIKERIDFLYETKIPLLQQDNKDADFDLKKENALLKDKLAALRKVKVVKWKLALKKLTNKLTGKNRKFSWED